MRRHAKSLGLAAVLLVLTGTMPASGAAPGSGPPSRRAILLLYSQTGNLRQYGTGVVVGRNTVITAAHVLTRNVRVVLPPASVAGQVACRTRLEGVAVVRVPLPPGTPSYRISSRRPAVGERVIVAGYPFRRWRVATGRVTRIIRSANLSGRSVRFPMIVFTPALDYGASGSPVLDLRGQVIGVTVATNRRAGYSIAVPTATGLQSCRRFLP
jgi:S1-C subfamily serine protease